MKINRLILSGYKRFLLNNISTIEYTPESIYQLILGTNGSGKSSLLSELSPVPGQPGDFVKGGKKEVVLDHLGHQYRLVSDFGKGNKHDFYRGDENLNPGGTRQVQKELVAQHFGVTQEIHDLLTGGIKFTQLGPAKRREWITKLSRVDFTYALGVYQNFKTAARDAQGALKHTKQRIVAETNRLIALNEIDSVEERYNALHDELNVLFTERDNGAKEVFESKAQFDNTLKSLRELTEALLTSRPARLEGYSFDSLQDVDETLNKTLTQEKVQEGLRERIGKEFNELQQLLTGLKENDVENFEHLKREHDRLLTENHKLKKKLKTFPDINANPVTAHKSLHEVTTTLHQILGELPANIKENGETLYTKALIGQAKEALPKIHTTCRKLQASIDQNRHRLSHMNSVENVQCPQCDYRWTPGVEPSQKKWLEDHIVKQEKEYEKHQHDIEQWENYLEGARAYSQSYGVFKHLTQQHTSLNKLWDAMLNAPELREDPSFLLRYVKLFGNELDIHLQIHQNNERLEKMAQHLESSQSGQTNNGLSERLMEVESTLENTTQEIESLKAQYQQLKHYRHKVKRYLEGVEKMDALAEQMLEKRNELVRSYRSEGIEKVIRLDQEELASIQGKRTQKQTLQGVIKDLEDDERQLEIDFKALTTLANLLSPTDGLIAEQLTGFIEHFIGHVNQIIENIWTYEFKVIPCGIENTDLDYKFPLMVRQEGEGNRCPDIAKGSEAQVEILNFAFRLVIMTYLNLEDYPLYIDELGRSFDEQHRVNVMHFIKQLVDTGNYSQLFMVSHYASEFGAFTQAETLVLDSTNISIPQRHNEQVTIY